VYRTGVEETQRDWSALDPLADRTAHEALAGVKPGDLQALQKEFLLAVFVPGSVVEAVDSRGVSRHELVSGQPPGEADQGLVSPVRLFQVVSRTLVSKRFVTTERLARMRSMHVPVVLQRLAICEAAAEEPGTLAAAPEGVPEVQDLLSLGSWRDLRKHLHSWTVRAVREDGSLELEGKRSLANLAWTVLFAQQCS
jgi:hypothetical protein